MQVSIIEFARNVCGMHDAHSIELDPNTTHPVISLMPDQNGVEDIGGTLRLGSYPCVLDKTSKAYALYGDETIAERHRHRYEVNNDYQMCIRDRIFSCHDRTKCDHTVNDWCFYAIFLS